MTEAEWLASDDPLAMLRHYLLWGSNGGPLPSDRKLRLFAVACRAVWDGMPCQNCGGSGELPLHVRRQGDTRRVVECSACHGTGRVGGLTDPRSRLAAEVAERFADGLAVGDEMERLNIIFCLMADPPDDQLRSLLFMSWWCIYGDEQLSQNAHYFLDMAAQLGMPPATQAAILREIFGNPFRPVPDRYVLVGSGYGIDRWPWLTHTVLDIARTIYDERRFEECPVLADALEDAGCDDEGLLRHLWGEELVLSCNLSVPKWIPLRGPHVRGCWALDLILGKE